MKHEIKLSMDFPLFMAATSAICALWLIAFSLSDIASALKVAP